ncbi:MAG TPA: hypothetical protein PLV21_07735 [Cyclobacteriaceae bacterium]|nr:hypothetical protein [Cyclobacteriaceae bacterium]HRJ81756.1 hypothetical protein [Cyclobacteriaceae bacterium]
MAKLSTFDGMIFRSKLVSRIISITVGVIFLNLSFIMMEVDLLNLSDKNTKLYENLIRFVSGGGCEEEDFSGDSSKDYSAGESKFNTHVSDGLLNDIELMINGLLVQTQCEKIRTVCLDITTPPPKA